MSIQVGDRVGDYEITGIIGRGGMGSVFKVRNILTDRIEAMKIVLPDFAANTDAAERFLREIRVHAALEHPNIAHLRTALHWENQVVMVMEFIEGVTLEECLYRGALNVQDSVRYIGQVLAALEYAHSRGIIHRDIKPANMLVTKGGIVKLTDFGIAQAPGERAFTRTGMAMGSLYYMSPEQVRAEMIDGRSDLYSVGVTLYELVTRQHPIDGAGEYAILNAHLTAKPRHPSELNPSLPPVLSFIILKALEKSPADRYQTASEFREALRQVGGVETVGPSLPSAPRDFDAARLEAVEAALTVSLGPIARRVVALTAQRSSNIDELCRLLSEQIPDTTERQRFLRTVGATAQVESTGTKPAPAWSDDILAPIRQALAPYVGPIAGVMVTRAARAARSKQELFDKLAAELSSDEDRKGFLGRVQR